MQPFDQLDHIVDMISGANPVFGRFDAERFAVVKKSLRKFLRVVANAHARSRRIGDDAVVHVGQVHDVLHLVAAQLQEPPKNVLKDEGAIVADVRVVVHRRSAGVHADPIAFLWRESFDLSAQRVVKSYFVHRSPVNLCLKR